MAELPPPDVMDSRGRMRRLVIALVVGVVVAGTAFLIADHMARPDDQVRDGVYDSTHVANAYKFVWFVTAFAGAIAFSITLTTLQRMAKSRERAERVPPAKQIS